MLDKAAKQKVIAKFKTHAGDTGSTEVQIGILSEEIKQLSDHLKTHKKDNSSRRGLLRKVNERRKLLKYLARENQASYDKITSTLKLKKTHLKEVEAILSEEIEEVVFPEADAPAPETVLK